MTTPSQVSYTQLAENKGKPRIWIEGAKLLKSGFVRGATYSVCDLANQVLVLQLDPNGIRTVSGRTRNEKDIPIIDLTMPWLAHKYDKGSRLRIEFTENEITITLHHEEANQVEREQRLLKNLSKKSVKSGTLCVGAGVSTLALHESAESAGIQTSVSWVVDMELKYLQVAAANNYVIDDDTMMIVGKIEEVEPKYYTPVDLLHVSIDCAGLSGAGYSKHKQLPTEHKSATSIFGLVNAIKSANPSLIISENVTEGFNSPMYQLLTLELERTGYKVFHRIMYGHDTPTFETRNRYWLVAISEGLANGFEWAAPGDAVEPVTLNELLDEVIPESMWADNEYLKAKAITDAAAGKGFRRQLLTGEETSCGTIGRHYAKKRSTEPFLTRADGKERLLSKTEHCRVKKIPEKLVENVCVTTAHQVLGQSVDFLQAVFIGSSVFQHLKRRYELV
jgi:DNA (cytosine-5)-methyltransferase 1